MNILNNLGIKGIYLKSIKIVHGKKQSQTKHRYHYAQWWITELVAQTITYKMFKASNAFLGYESPEILMEFRMIYCVLDVAWWGPDYWVESWSLTL